MREDVKERGASTGEAPATPRRRRWPLVLGLVVLLLLALAVPTALAARDLASARDELLAARTSVREGQRALRGFDLLEAHRQFESAETDFSSGADRLSGPLLRRVRGLPVVGPNVQTASALAEAGVLVAGGAADVAGVVAELPDGIRSLAPQGGVVPVGRLQELAEPAARAVEYLAEAEALVRAAPQAGLVEEVADARAEFLDEIVEARGMADVATQLGEAMPKFFGASQPRRYLFVAQNPAEIRGTGGFMGAFATVTFDRGRPSFSEFDSIHDLQSFPVSQVEAPNPDYAARYNRYGGAGFWPALNATPDFPSAATAMEQLWRKARGSDLDGVIAADPFALAELVRLAGPVEVPGFGTVETDEVVEVVANEAYGELGAGEGRKRVLGAIAVHALGGALSSGVEDPLSAARALIDASGDGHVLVHSADAEVQEALGILGVTGELLNPAGDYLSVIVNNTAANKVDYYMGRTVQYTVRLHEDGSAEATARVTFTNNAPSEGLPKHVIGPNVDGLGAGDSRSLVSVFCTRRCDVTDAEPPLGEDGFRRERELGHTVFTTSLDVASGEEKALELTWELPNIWAPDDGGGLYRLTVQAQPTIRPTRYLVTVVAPDGMVISDAGDEMEMDGTEASWSGEVRGDRVFDVVAAPDGTAG